MFSGARIGWDQLLLVRDSCVQGAIEMFSTTDLGPLVTTPRRRYDEEEPNTPQWAAHRKHFFILSSAGKPIFSRYGDEAKLSPLAGVLQALISFVCDSGGDTIRHLCVGRHRAVFCMRGSLYLVAVSTCGDTVPYLRQQLDHMHAQIISILTSKVEQMFLRNASFDLRNLLGGTDRVRRHPPATVRRAALVCHLRRPRSPLASCPSPQGRERLCPRRRCCAR